MVGTHHRFGVGLYLYIKFVENSLHNVVTVGALGVHNAVEDFVHHGLFLGGTGRKVEKAREARRRVEIGGYDILRRREVAHIVAHGLLSEKILGRGVEENVYLGRLAAIGASAQATKTVQTHRRLHQDNASNVGRSDANAGGISAGKHHTVALAKVKNRLHTCRRLAARDYSAVLVDVAVIKLGVETRHHIRLAVGALGVEWRRPRKHNCSRRLGLGGVGGNEFCSLHLFEFLGEVTLVFVANRCHIYLTYSDVYLAQVGLLDERNVCAEFFGNFVLDVGLHRAAKRAYAECSGIVVAEILGYYIANILIISAVFGGLERESLRLVYHNVGERDIERIYLVEHAAYVRVVDERRGYQCYQRASLRNFLDSHRAVVGVLEDGVDVIIDVYLAAAECAELRLHHGKRRRQDETVCRFHHRYKQHYQRFACAGRGDVKDVVAVEELRDGSRLSVHKGIFGEDVF